MSLLPNEKLTFKIDNHQDPRLMSDEDINDKYSTGEIRIVTEQARYPLPSIVTMIDSGNYNLNPEFQRRHRWYNYKQSQLIESFIMNVPIPPIFLYEYEFGRYEVMDGLQRLTAIYSFYTDKLILERLEEWPELEGRRYSDLPDQIKRGIDRRYISSIILLQETAKSEEDAKKLKQLVFERINSGGVDLTPQESRNAIYNGSLNQLCRKLSRNIYLCRTWDIPEPTKKELTTGEPSNDLLENYTYQRMEDVELVLRFFAYRQRLYHPGTSLKDYLDQFLNYGNSLPQEVLDKFEVLFTETLKLVYEVFGEKAFWTRRMKNSKWVWWYNPSKTVYDPLMYVFSQHLKDKENILSRRSEFQNRIQILYENNQEKFNWKKHRYVSDMKEMNELFEKFVTDIIGSTNEG